MGMDSQMAMRPPHPMVIPSTRLALRAETVRRQEKQAGDGSSLPTRPRFLGKLTHHPGISALVPRCGSALDPIPDKRDQGSGGQARMGIRDHRARPELHPGELSI